MDRVVEAYTRHGRQQEADYCMVSFFMNFENIKELTRHIEIAEQSAQEAGVLS